MSQSLYNFQDITFVCNILRNKTTKNTSVWTQQQ